MGLLEDDLLASFNPWTHMARVSAAVLLAHSWKRLYPFNDKNKERIERSNNTMVQVNG